MEFKNEKTIAYCIAIILLIVGITCYAAFPNKRPEEPIRIMLKATAGEVLFDHKVHTSDEGYGIECMDCHHAWDEDSEDKPQACGECHKTTMDEALAGKEIFDHDEHMDDFGIDCIDCHHEWDEDSGEDPVSCGECHKDEETDENSIKYVDAYHEQCIGCHEDFGSGPTTDCSACHVPVKRADAFHDQCIDCHEEDGFGPVDCSDCHVL